MIEIRTIEPRDSIAALTALLHAAYSKLGEMGLNYTAVDQSPEVTARRIGIGTCFVALDGPSLIGTIVVEPPIVDRACPYFARPGAASAHQLAVAPSHQGRGIGSRLLSRAEEWASENGYSELVLDTAEPAEHLTAMYGRRGYEHIGFVQWEGKRYRSVLMAKRVANAALTTRSSAW